MSDLPPPTVPPGTAVGPGAAPPPQAYSGPIIEATALTKTFGSHQALDNLTISVRPGVTGLVGANGAGKTTLMSILLGLQFATSGSVSVLGVDPVTNGAVVRSQVGWAPERNVFPDDMKAFDYVRHLAEVKGLPRDEARARASDSLFLVGLGEERFRPLGTMSTGQRQRVKLAQSIAAAPALVLLDEPTDGLDPMQRESMLELIRSISTDFGINVLLSSHLLEEVETVCDDVVAIDAGRLIAAGPVGELLDGDTRLRVEFASALAPEMISWLVDRITAAGLEVTADVSSGDHVLFVGGGDDDVIFDTCRDALADAQVPIRSFGVQRQSLDDLFVGAAS